MTKKDLMFNQPHKGFALKLLTPIYVMFMVITVHAQSYTSYFTGNQMDTVTNPLGGVCMMGGASEHDEAMKWFLNRCNGGDVLVLRASGSNGYNAYLYSQLGIAVNSVESIVFHNASASQESYIHQKIMHAEAIWFAGGDQWDYVSYWRDTPVDSLINIAILERNIVIGGTSAGTAILGGFYFSARNGTVTSEEALADPYTYDVAVDSAHFLEIPFLNTIITDSHYSERDREGRHVVFLARILTDWGVEAQGIACDEYTAVCIDENGTAFVYGDYPSRDDNAYFIRTNCELINRTPEECSESTPLTWFRNGEALKVYNAKGTFSGSQTFDLMSWANGSGGSWENWYVENGILSMSENEPVNCTMTSIPGTTDTHIPFLIYPNPSWNSEINISNPDDQIFKLELLSPQGIVLLVTEFIQQPVLEIPTSNLVSGIYLMRIQSGIQFFYYRILIL